MSPRQLHPHRLGALLLALGSAGVSGCIGPRGSPLPLSAAGGRIAFQSDRDGNAEVYVMNADGSDPLNLTRNPAEDWYPAWSPDCRRIVFMSNRDGNFEIYTMRSDGSEVRRLTADTAMDERPAWSPDGRKIAFGSFEAATTSCM